MRIDVGTMTVTCCDLTAPFTLPPRHRRMFLEGLDVIGLTLTYRDRIGAFSEAHWARQRWVRDVASRTAKRLGRDLGRTDERLLRTYRVDRLGSK